MASVKIMFLGLLMLLISSLAAANRILMDSGTNDDNNKDIEVGSSWDNDKPNNEGSVQFGGSWEVGGGKGGQKGFNFGGGGGGGGVSVGVGVGVGGGGKGGWSGGNWGGGGGAQYPTPVPAPVAPGGGGKGGWSKGAGGGKGGWSGGSWGSWGSGSGWSAGPCAACPPQCLRVNWVDGKTMDTIPTDIEHKNHHEPVEMEDQMQDKGVMEDSPDNE